MIVSCLDCGVDVPFRGGELLDAIPEIRRVRPAARCPTCYRQWQGMMAAEVIVEQRAFELAVRDLTERGRIPSPSVLRDLMRSGFASQWNDALLNWKRRQHQPGHGRDIE
jgi:hypothetical protein